MENIQKPCSKCLVDKRLDEFDKSTRYKSGYTAMCTECRRTRERLYEANNREKRVAKHAKWRDENRESINARNRQRWSEDEEWKKRKEKYRGMYKEWRAEYSSDYKKKNRDKCNAREQLRYWVDKGKIIKPENCEMCGKNEFRVEAHHADYSKPLDVDWFCQKCHLKLHRLLKKENNVQPERLSKEGPKGQAIV